jgi:hypothetical protein
MKITIDSRLFAAPVSYLQLAAIAHFGLEGRHRIFLSEPDALEFDRFFDGRPVEDREEWDLILDQSYVLEAREPSAFEISISNVVPTNLEAYPPTATLADGVDVLSRPQKVLLENNVRDRSFLLALANEAQRNFLRQKEKFRHLEFEHGGGLSSMQEHVENSKHPSTPLLLSTIFDSDSLRPNEPSDQSQSLAAICRRRRVEHHLLQRRAIENYLPLEALRSWAYGSRDRKRRETFQAFLRLTDDQQYHYNMKAGFHGDAAREGKSAGDLYVNLPDKDRAMLQHGFGRRIGESFEGAEAFEEHFRRSGASAEIAPVIARLIARLR